MKTRTIECDVAIIGAGIAGCATAQSAAEAGAKTVVVERASTVTAHGLDVGAIGSRLQKAAGVEIDPLDAARLIYAWGQSKANYDLIRVYTDRSGKVMDHYIDMAEKYGLKVTLNDSMTARPDWDGLEDRFRMFRTAHNFSPADKPAAVEDKAAIRHFVRMLRKDAEARGAEFLFRCTPEKLTRSGSRVTGLTAVTAEGEKLRIRLSVMQPGASSSAPAASRITGSCWKNTAPRPCGRTRTNTIPRAATMAAVSSLQKRREQPGPGPAPCP